MAFDGFLKIDWPVSTFHPATETSSVKFRATRAVHVQILGNVLLPACDRHDDLERRSRRQLSLDRFVQQRLLGIGDQSVPFVA